MRWHFKNDPVKGTYFALLLPCFFVFHGYVEAYRLVKPFDALLLLVFYCVVSIAITSAFSFVFRSWRKGALFTFCLQAIHFFFGSFHDTLKQALGDSPFTKYSILLSGIAILTLSIFFYLRKTGKTFDKGVRYLNALFLLLITLDAALLIASISREEKKDVLPHGLSACATCTTPDIYWIVADEYAGRQQLADRFGFDNAPFENGLKSRGFHVVNNSRSNYNFTPFSIASTLNLSYLPLRDTGRTIGDVPMVMGMVGTNTFTRFLGKQGYKIVNHSVFDLPGEPRGVSSSFLPNKTRYITAQTLLSRLERDLFYHLLTSLNIEWMVKKGVYNNLQNNKVLYEKTVATSGTRGGPKFVYTHLSMPHPPYYYNELGAPVDYNQLVKEDERDYVGYLKYANKKLLLLVDEILKNSGQPPIIILTSDHGLRSGAPAYHFMNLCAVYTPDKHYTPYYDGLSAVNLFRVLLREQFRQQLPLLPDKTYFLKD